MAIQVALAYEGPKKGLHFLSAFGCSPGQRTSLAPAARMRGLFFGWVTLQIALHSLWMHPHRLPAINTGDHLTVPVAQLHPQQVKSNWFR